MNYLYKIVLNNRPRTALICGIAALLLLCFWLSIPSKLFNSPTSFVIEDKDGNLMNAIIASDGQWRFPCNNKIPDKFKICLTTFEDQRFYYHFGVDPFAICRAIKSNIVHKGISQGGSTLTMQLIRLSRHNKTRNVWQKIIEAIEAVRVECSYSKAEILSEYSSNAPFGSNVVGLDAACWRYYGRSAEKLSWGEMAALAVLPNSPSLVHPGKNRQILLKKRNDLLERLVMNKSIDRTTCDLAKSEPLPAEPKTLPQFAPHLLQRFKAEEVSKNSKITSIRTTLDLALQKNVMDIVNQHHDLLKQNKINNACALVLDVESGNVISYVGNVLDKDIDTERDVDVIKAWRSPGSTLKPILYAAMLSAGMILPNSLVADIPTHIGGYTPQNFDLTYDGAVPASKALARSLNIPAVRLLQQFKYQRFFDVLKGCGITTLNRPADSYGLSLILGGSEVTMWDLAGLYASMARSLLHQRLNNGFCATSDFHPPNYVLNKCIKEKKGEIFNSLDPTSIWFTFQAMQEVVRPGEEGLWQQFSSAEKIAWKTGTSYGFRDGWAIGVTPKNVVAVWVGNCDGEGRPGLVGVQTAAPIMFDIFRLLPSTEWFKVPENDFTYLPVCKQSGMRANPDCSDIDTMMVPVNSYKSSLCIYHKLIHLDAKSGYRVNDKCESPIAMIHKSWFILPPAMEWYYKAKNHDYVPLPPFKNGCQTDESFKTMEILYPPPEDKIYIPYELNGKRGKTIFSAAHRKPESKIYWSLDNSYLGTTTNFHQIAVDPEIGKHILTLVDQSGESITRTFEIIAK